MKALVDAPSPEAEITIGMPSHNSARTIARAIRSVQAQSITGWRLHISDDQSSDETVALAQGFAATDPRIRVSEQATRQHFMNFATPLEQASTPFFVWLAADDWWEPGFLQETLTALKEAPDAPSAVPQGMFDTGRAIANLDDLPGPAHARIAAYLRHPGGTRMYGLMRTSAAQAAFPGRNMTGYDWAFMTALLKAGPQIVLPQVLINREETDWIAYARTEGGVLPLWQMTRSLIGTGRIPLRALPALLRLNLRKHEESLAVNHPQAYARWHWLYRRLGFPLARRGGQLQELAEADEREGTASPITALARAVGAPALDRKSAPEVTAILCCRNAGNHLRAALDHFEAQRVSVALIDNGSTDDTLDIARAGPVREIVQVPFDGVFDLTAQLALKQEMIRATQDAWILHADADEFLDPPPGRTLRDFLAEAERAGKRVVPTEEQLFLPQFEDEAHDPEGFQTHMRFSLPMRERDPKQRLFHRDMDLQLWRATGGHTVTHDGSCLTDPLRLRHYPGLSLDDLRAQYYARVFAPSDLARRWHGSRHAAAQFEIVEPHTSGGDVHRLPFFRPWAPVASEWNFDVADLLMVAGEGVEASDVLRRIETALPGLRVAQCRDVDAIPRRAAHLPVLSVLGHPAHLHQPHQTRSQERTRASNWTRGIARTRQWAVCGATAFAELRIEEADDQLQQTILGLFRGPVPRGASGFIRPESPPIARDPCRDPISTITGPLARDLGYV